MTRQTQISNIDIDAFREFAISDHVAMNRNVLMCLDGNKKILDFYIRIENLIPDYKFICEKLDMPYVDPPRLKSDIRADAKHYSAYYDDATRDAVGKKYRDYIEAFDYQFERK